MCYYYTGATNLVSMPQFEHVDNLKVRSAIGRAIWLVLITYVDLCVIEE